MCEISPEKITLTKEEVDKFLHLLENPPEPNQKLREALKSYQEGHCIGGLENVSVGNTEGSEES